MDYHPISEEILITQKSILNFDMRFRYVNVSKMFI